MREGAAPGLEGIFSEGGLLSRQLGGFEFRPEQLGMAREVAGALERGEVLIVEAGTGVGKSLAYLVPLVLWLEAQDNPRAIVSTYSKALQKQLHEKELPFIKRHLFPWLRYALSFGSENYVCLRRLGQSTQFGLFDVDENAAVDEVMQWVKETATGLRGEIPVGAGLWAKVRRESDTCLGKDCRFFSGCFYQQAKALERKAHIIIVNHHLFFAHVAADYGVLPESPCVVFDEAHELEEVASDYLGVEISESRLRSALDAIVSPKGRGLLLRLRWLDTGQLQELSAVVDRARRAGRRFFGQVERFLGEKRSARTGAGAFDHHELSEALAEVQGSLERLGALSGDEEEGTEIEATVMRTRLFRDGLAALCRQEYGDCIYWASQENRSIRLTGTPVNVSGIIREKVFGHFAPVVLTSATLTTNRTFEYIRERLGLSLVRTAAFSSPFDFRSQARLYIPEHIPDPNSPAYAGTVAEEVERILRLTQGNTLVLFTSYALLNDVASRIDIRYRVLRQGDLDNFALLEEFRNAQPAALFGTYSFWQGVDLQGDILRCVVITKLPFSVPTDPVLGARLERMSREGRDPFSDYQVPAAVIHFKQGFGRLIRSKTDRGVVAVLDSRVVRKGYGRQFLNSLPDLPVVDDLEALRHFLAPPPAGLA